MSSTVEHEVRSASDSRWFDVLVRVGIVAYGVVHLLIGWLALQLAFGDNSGAPSQQGALRTLADQALGAVLLWVTGIGLFVMALWQVTEALWGHTREEGAKRTVERVGSAGKTVVYAVLGFSAIRVAVGSGSSSDEDSMTRKLMDLPAGEMIVVVIGLVVIGIGGAYLYRGVTSGFDEKLDGRALSGTSGTVVERLGQAGYAAKAVALAVLGGLFVWAGATYDASKAGGLDTALRTLLDESVGPWLLAVVAAGIICYGLFCFAWARYADTSS
jgi:hypothetical protein